MINFLNSKQFSVMVESFVEKYCFIYNFEEDLNEQSLKKKRKHYRVFKELINQLVYLFLRRYDVSQDILYYAINNAGPKAGELKDEVKSWFYALGEFYVFCLFMAQENLRADLLIESEYQRTTRTPNGADDLRRAYTTTYTNNQAIPRGVQAYQPIS